MPQAADRLTLGATTITYLVDGSGKHNPDTMLPGLDWAAHPGSLTDGHLVLTFGAFLVQTGDRNILVDLGIGDLDMDIPGLAHVKGGRLLDSLAERGLSPKDIDTVVYTHLHLDHIGWTSDVPPTLHGHGANTPSGLTFARARHLMAEPEWRYWTSGEGAHEMGGPDPVATLGPLGGAVDFVQGGDTIAPGVTVEDTAGHTPGHLGVVVRDPSGAIPESVLIAGDIFHAPVEMAEPTCVFSTDVDPDQARKVRNRTLQRPDTVIAAGHFTDGVFGRVTEAGTGYTWTAVTHAPATG
ncbi:glyoxylase-like metal-dependent hydrolase (beta-lactamase superfamily II) [Streptacidiphilus sp. MAP12-33]|uniref:MBL fold metallo-hydrolase n=1 Tax=Streptacidiphilus sp. MAP12-33 TaxID=3156266 RepID=UPI0035184C59